MRINRFQYTFSGLLVLSDGIFSFLSVFWAYTFRFYGALKIPYIHLPPRDFYHGLGFLYALVFLVIAGYSGVYRHRNTFRVDDFLRLFKTTGLAWLITMSALFLYRDFSYSRLVFVFSFVFSALVIPMVHYIIRRIQADLLQRGKGIIRLAVVGKDETGEMIERQIKRFPELGYRFEGYFSAGDDSLGSIDSIGEIVKERGIQYVIITIPSVSREEVLNIVEQCEQQDVMIRLLPDLLNIITSQTSFDELAGIPLIGVKEIRLKGVNVIIKRIFDFGMSLIAVILLSPLLAIIALLVKITSKGPVIYAQKRVSLDGREFAMFKFRSMYTDAESKSGPVWAVKGDSRCTPLGAFLRKTSLDELPQFFNVIMGHMSLVGPRPERMFFVEQFKKDIPRYMVRHRVKCGITGWAQVNGQRGNSSIEERTRYDLYYIENWSLWLDIKILLRTVFEVWSHDTAY